MAASYTSEAALLHRFGRWVYRHRWVVILLWLLLLVGSGILAPRVGSVLKGGFGEQNTEARRGLDLLEADVGLSPSVLVLVFSSDNLIVDSDRYRIQVESALAGLEDMPELDRIDTVYSTGNRRMVSDDGHTTYALVFVDIELNDSVDMIPDIRRRIRPGELDMWLTGASAIFSDINAVTEKDLQRAELITFPLVAIALLLIFGTLVSVAAPLAIGGIGLTITLAVIYLLGRVTDMSTFSLNTASLLGVGVAIDYSLLMVNRFREELQHRSVEESVGVTVATAGKAIVFSAATTVLGLAGLLTFELMMLRSIGLGGIVVILASMAVALTLLPAMLGVVGHHIDAAPILPARLLSRGLFWRRLASWVMAHPFLVIVPLIIFLLILGTPFLNGRLGLPWAGVLPPDVEARQGWDLAVRELGEGELTPILVAATSEEGVLTSRNLDTLYDFTRAVEGVDGVGRIESIVNLGPGITKEQYRLLYSGQSPSSIPELSDTLEELGGGRTTMLRIYSPFSINSEEAQRVVREVRAAAPDGELTFLITGASASLMDAVDAMYDDFPRALVLVIVSVYLVLLVLFRSVILPLKAIVMNGMSIFASYGALVFIFQQGHFEGLLNFTSSGFLEATLPILLFMILFGLSMDYEVFLLSRIKEIYDTTGDNTLSVALGLERTGKIITSAALVLVLVAGSFALGDIIIIKALGLGIAIAIFLDSTVVRALLVPALMRILGDLNWWAPRVLKKALPA
ncbi:MAG: MMPL family transporter [Dehalococcoidia bacterium]